MNFMPDQLNRLQWEDLERRAFHTQNERFLNVMRRAPVPGGWLLHCYRELSCHTKRGPLQSQNSPLALGVGEGSGLTYIPDPKHEWTLAAHAHEVLEGSSGPREPIAKKSKIPERVPLSA